MKSHLAVIGECLVDVVESETSAPQPHVGGSPLNVAVGLARLDHPVVFAGRRGSDDYGRMIARSLRAQGITTVLEADDLPTSVATATLDPTGQASYEFSLDWALPPAEELTTALTQAAGTLEHLHTGSLATMIEPGAAVVKTVFGELRHSATVSYDPNYRPTLVPNREQARTSVEELVSLADIIQASTDDLELLYPERSVAETMNAWLDLGPALVTVTRGHSGAMALARSGFAEQQAFPAEVADTVGAGDSFMAATLSTLRQQGLLGAQNRQALQQITPDEVAQVLMTAAQAAAITSSRYGAQPPTGQELAAALAPGASTA